MDYIDLHVHSHFSDGMSSPSENIELAKKIGLRAIALSDHDTIKGVAEAEAKAKELELEFIRGVEISTFDTDTRSIHLLGFMWKDEEPFYDVEKRISESRNERNIAIYRGLKEQFGFDISLEEMKGYSKSTIINRGNLSRALVEKGYATDFIDADNKVKQIKHAGDAYGIRIEEAIKIIHSAGGIAVMAHPYSLKKADEDLLKKIKYLKEDYGLDGIECYHTNHSKDQTDLFLSFADKLDMLVSGGSDYHGAFKPTVHLGKGKHENFFVPYNLLEKMKEYYSKK